MKASAHDITNSQESLQRFPVVSERTALGRTAIYDRIKRGTFPAPVRIGRYSVAWKKSDIDAWIESRPTTRPVELAG